VQNHYFVLPDHTQFVSPKAFLVSVRHSILSVSALALSLSVTLVGGCASTSATQTAKPASSEPAAKPKVTPKPLAKGMDSNGALDPFPSTYKPLPGVTTAILGATILTAAGQEIENGTILFSEGKIVAVGKDVAIPEAAKRVDGRGKFVTPGIIDIHSHLGVYPSPSLQANSDGNEATDPNTAEVWAEHSIWPQDPGFNRAREGGVTTVMVLPGSANLFGGRSVTLKNVPSISQQGMKFPGAPHGLKMACGENPKRVYGSRSRSPSTRMGNIAVARRAWIDAVDYNRKWNDYRAKVAAGEAAGDPPKRDLKLETLSGALTGDILIQNHCYRADEMALMIDMAKEFGYKITAFHHSSEAYKLAPVLKDADICSATWADWQGFKMEALDGIAENAGILQAYGACTIIHSDDATMIQHLNQEAALAMGAAARAGIPVSRLDAIKWITANPARAMGIGAKTGSLEAGKMADIVLWDRDPFSTYALAQIVYIDGAIAYDRNDPATHARSDFDLGRPSLEPKQ
jgi:imidazolonepropionase-like amidohydrolase